MRLKYTLAIGAIALAIASLSVHAGAVNNIYVTSKGKVNYSIDYSRRTMTLQYAGSATRTGKCQFVPRRWQPRTGRDYGKGYHWGIERFISSSPGTCSRVVSIDSLNPGSNRVIVKDPYPAEGGPTQKGWISFKAYP